MQEGSVRKILVTGANGFIGSRVCRLLAASGYTIRVMCRESSDLSLLKDIPYTKTIADITKPETLPSAVTGIDYIIHVAGLIKARNEQGFFEVNQKGTLNLLNAVKNNNLELKKLVLVSSVAASGPASTTPRKEDDPPQPITTYGRSKLAGEETLSAFYDLFPITIVRPHAVYGPGDKGIYGFFDAVNKGIRPYMGGGYNFVHLVYVDDLARGIKIAMESEQSAGQVYFCADSKAYTVREVLDMMGDLMGKKGIGITIPLWLLNIIAFISETYFKLIGKAPLFSRDKVRELTDNWLIDVSKARDQLGFETEFDLKTGAQLTIDWYRKHGWLK
jgi:nucleoside-diphosphate-sugar epimerase